VRDLLDTVVHIWWDRYGVEDGWWKIAAWVGFGLVLSFPFAWCLAWLDR